MSDSMESHLVAKQQSTVVEYHARIEGTTAFDVIVKYGGGADATGERYGQLS